MSLREPDGGNRANLRARVGYQPPAWESGGRPAAAPTTASCGSCCSRLILAGIVLVTLSRRAAAARLGGRRLGIG